MTEHAHVREVGLRDGLQSIAEVLPTEEKIAWLEAEHAAGVREIEVSSFVRPSCSRSSPMPRSWCVTRSPCPGSPYRR